MNKMIICGPCTVIVIDQKYKTICDFAKDIKYSVSKSNACI